MNERIKELYNQSGGLVRMYEGKLTYFPAYQKNVGDGNFEFSSFDPEKFAELIVKECCSKLVEMGESWHEFARNPPEGQAHNASGALFAAYRLKEDAVDEIKEHFGVE